MSNQIIIKKNNIAINYDGSALTNNNKQKSFLENNSKKLFLQQNYNCYNFAFKKSFLNKKYIYFLFKNYKYIYW